MFTNLKKSIKSSTKELALAGLSRMAESYIDRHPYCRMCDISKNVFGDIDHKQMLASVVVRHLVINNRVAKFHPYKDDKNGYPVIDKDGNWVQYKHFVYVTK